MEEPKRKSYLDVLKRYLSFADRFGLTTRFVYIGEFKGSKDEIHKRMKANVKALNEEYSETVLSGLLLVYPKFFLHLIEASEEIIYRHLQAVFADNADEILGRVIYFPAYHNIYKMYFSEWCSVFIPNPPVLLSNIEKFEIEEVERQIKNCLFKMYSLSEYLRDIRIKSHHKFLESLKTLDKTVPHHLPEVTIVEYLLIVEAKVIEDLRVYLKRFNAVPFLNFYNERIWPAPIGFVPHIDINKIEEKPESQ